MPDMDLADAVIDDGRWTETVTHRSIGEATNTGGYAIESDGAEQDIEAVIRPESARRWVQLPEGIDSTAEWLMIVKSDQGVEQGDEIEYRETWYTVGAVESVTSVDNYDVFVLTYE